MRQGPEFFERQGIKIDNWMESTGRKILQAMNRWSSHVITRNSCNKPVEKLKNVEVCGDTIAWLRRG